MLPLLYLRRAISLSTLLGFLCPGYRLVGGRCRWACRSSVPAGSYIAVATLLHAPWRRLLCPRLGQPYFELGYPLIKVEV